MSGQPEKMRLRVKPLGGEANRSCLEVLCGSCGLAMIFFCPTKQRWYGHLSLYDGLAGVAEYDFHLTHVFGRDAQSIAQRYLQNIGGRRA